MNSDTEAVNRPTKAKRIIALIGVILICIMVIATLLTAFLDGSGRLFRSFLIVTIALPIALWVFLWAFGALTHKHTIASYDLDQTKESKTGKEDIL